MSRDLKFVLIGSILAIAITTTMDATGLLAFSALPLCPLLFGLWYVQRMNRRDVGFTFAKPSDYVPALAYPMLVIGAIIAGALVAGTVHPKTGTGNKTAINFALVFVGTVLTAIITEEGFFRGWLWAALSRAGLHRTNVLLWTSLIFMAWHLSAVLLPTGFNPPLRQVPIFLINATLLGINWGLLRACSGSVIVSSVSHGLWNAAAYTLFGFGAKTGYLGIEQTGIWGPEVGVAGVVGNLISAVFLYRRVGFKSA
jgi:membrane protease YdiL (CAAX protease family)